MPIGLPADPVALRKHSTWFIVYGVVMCLLGLFAIAAPASPRSRSDSRSAGCCCSAAPSG